MKVRLFRFPCLVRILYPYAIFRVKTSGREIFLTFDDGPAAGSTEKILDILLAFKVRAVFFCTGQAAQENPHLINRIRSSGHIVGNHGYLHLNGFRCTSEKYLKNAETSSPVTSGVIFRPPYGRMNLRQYRMIKRKFRIIFWDLMPYDFDASFGPAKSLNILKKKIRPGSVIVLHDNPGSTVHDFLSEFIQYCLEEQ